MPVSTVAVKVAQQHQTTVNPMKYSSDDDGKIYQRKPTNNKPSQFKPKGWTDTVLGYVNEAKRLTLCILRNRDSMGRPNTWAAHINISSDLTPRQHADLWTVPA